MHTNQKGRAMSNVSREIYRKIDGLFTDLQQIEPFTRVDLAALGLPDINVVVFESRPDNINFILSRYKKENGRSIPCPCFEIAANPRLKIANVVTYKDDHYFHSAVPEVAEVGEIAQWKANRYLYELLSSLPVKQSRAKG